MLYFESCSLEILCGPARKIYIYIYKKSVVQKCALNAISQSKHLLSLDDEYHDLGVFSTSRKS